jgi:hypothetical protein
MTFQPPSSPSDETPPNAPAPGGWAPPPAPTGGGSNSPSGFDPKSVHRFDWGIIGAGVVAFIFSLFSWYTVDVKGFGSGSESAWHGFFGWFAVLLAMVGSGVVAMSYFSPQVKLPLSNRLLGLGCYAAAILFMIIALFVFPEDVPDIAGVDTGRGVGFWVDLIVIIAGGVLSLMRLQASGEQLPGALSKIPNIGGAAK